jgi:hypothetical protein
MAYHGTTDERAKRILDTRFQPFNWLEDGIYFFEDHPRLSKKLVGE